MAQPLDALHFREIFGRTMKGPRGANMAYWVTPFAGDPEDPNNEERMTSREFTARVRSVQHALTDTLDHGEIFYVNNEISHILWDEAQRWPDDKLFHFEPGDFPTRVGFVYFDANLPLPTVLSRDGVQPLRALLWNQLLRSHEIDHPHWLVPGSDTGENADVVGKVVYSIVDNPIHWRNRTVQRVMREKIEAGKWITRHWLPIEYDVRWTANMASDLVDQNSGDYLTPDEVIEDKEGAEKAVRDVLKLLFTWTAFMQTELVGHHSFDSSSHDRVVAREGRPPAQVRIVTLRRYMSVPNPDAAQVEVDWTHRWKVREHYRNQRVGPGRTFVRRTLVREHWKGPEDKPQAHQDTIQALVR